MRKKQKIVCRQFLYFQFAYKILHRYPSQRKVGILDNFFVCVFYFVDRHTRYILYKKDLKINN